MRKPQGLEFPALRIVHGPSGPVDIAVCIADIREIAFADILNLLSKTELDRSFRHACDLQAEQTAKARGVLRLMLAQCTGEHPESFEIAEGGGRAPRLLSNPWQLHFNISHSHHHVVVAIGRTLLGVDIERIRANCEWEAIAAICFHPHENEHLRRAGEEARLDAFFEIWTRKEAYLKAKGTGMTEDLSAFSVVAPDEPVSPDDPVPILQFWSIQEFNAPCGYKAALASDRPHPAVGYCDLQLLFAAPYEPPAAAARAGALI
ncbi:4'-phosphopantetheinyl transferase sfp [bacterium MnTg02]|nr:4'-phosphopantetheinyl transferase sfp [bacterium MnTg02]